MEVGERAGRSRRESREGEELEGAGTGLDAPRVCCSSFVVLVEVCGAEVVLTELRGGDALDCSFPSAEIGNRPS